MSAGLCTIGDEIEIIGLSKSPKTMIIKDIEELDVKGIAGQNVNILIQWIEAWRD